MVTTKKQYVEEDLNDDNTTINVFVPPPSSGRRRKRAEVESSDVEEAEALTPSPKKRKVLPVRFKDGDEGLILNSRPVVEVPSRRMSPEEEKLHAEAPASSSKKAHRRFDSEDDTEDFYSTARERAAEDDVEKQEAIEEEDEDEDSDDDAPEAIGMQEAAQTVKSKEQDAAKAVKEWVPTNSCLYTLYWLCRRQKDAARQKRKDKEAILKKQSEDAKERKSTKKPTAVIDVDSEEDEDDALSEVDPAENQVALKAITNGHAIPDLLPLELLEDDDENAEDMAMEYPIQRVSKKHKFRDISEKKIKDRKVGGTTYRVTKSQSTHLAPKAAHNARSVKESWMQGRSGTKLGPNRKVVSKGFFKK